MTTAQLKQLFQEQILPLYNDFIAISGKIWEEKKVIIPKNEREVKSSIRMGNWSVSLAPLSQEGRKQYLKERGEERNMQHYINYRRVDGFDHHETKKEIDKKEIEFCKDINFENICHYNNGGTSQYGAYIEIASVEDVKNIGWKSLSNEEVYRVKNCHISSLLRFLELTSVRALSI